MTTETTSRDVRPTTASMPAARIAELHRPVRRPARASAGTLTDGHAGGSNGFAGAQEVLAAIPNRVRTRYRVRIETKELTFLGAPEQPDFAGLVIDDVPARQLIELKSLKRYVGGFRDRHLSYERIANVIRDDIEATYAPRALTVTLSFQPRGGASTTVTVPDESDEDPFAAWALSHGATR